MPQLADNKTYKIKDSYIRFKKENPSSDINFLKYKYIVSKFMKLVVNEILEGGEWNMGILLGRIRIKRVKRNPARKKVDFHATKLLRAEGVNATVYHTSDYWYRWYWNKGVSRVKNKSVYSFVPTGGPTGNRRKLVKLIKENEFAELNFKG